MRVQFSKENYKYSWFSLVDRLFENNSEKSISLSIFVFLLKPAYLLNFIQICLYIQLLTQTRTYSALLFSASRQLKI